MIFSDKSIRQVMKMLIIQGFRLLTTLLMPSFKYTLYVYVVLFYIIGHVINIV